MIDKASGSVLFYCIDQHWSLLIRYTHTILEKLNRINADYSSSRVARRRYRTKKCCIFWCEIIAIKTLHTQNNIEVSKASYKKQIIIEWNAYLHTFFFLLNHIIFVSIWKKTLFLQLKLGSSSPFQWKPKKILFLFCLFEFAFNFSRIRSVCPNNFNDSLSKNCRSMWWLLIIFKNTKYIHQFVQIN